MLLVSQHEKTAPVGGKRDGGCSEFAVGCSELGVMQQTPNTEHRTPNSPRSLLRVVVLAPCDPDAARREVFHVVVLLGGRAMVAAPAEQRQIGAGDPGADRRVGK